MGLVVCLLVAVAVCPTTQAVQDPELAGGGEVETFLEDTDVAFWITAFKELRLMPGAVRTIRRFHPSSPILMTVDKGGATSEFKKLCLRYECSVRETATWMGTPHSSGQNLSHHNFSCGGFLNRLAEMETFAPSARYIVIYEPDNRMLSRIRSPQDGKDVYQFGNMNNPFPADVFQSLEAVEGFPHGYSTAGGTMLRRSSIPAMLSKLTALDQLLEKHRGTYCVVDTCLFMLAGLSKLQLAGSGDVMQSSESCDSPQGALYPCYRCINSCKLQEDCYRRDEWLKPLPPGLRRLVNRLAYKYVVQPVCWVMQEPCLCPSPEAVRRATQCIEGCSYACPSRLHNLKGLTEEHATFLDCEVYDPGSARVEI